MSFHIQKGFDITPNGVLRPGSLQDYRVLKQQPWFQALVDSSSHVRFWVDWPTLQPSANFAVGDPNGRTTRTCSASTSRSSWSTPTG